MPNLSSEDLRLLEPFARVPLPAADLRGRSDARLPRDRGRILLVDDHRMMREGLRAVLERDSGFEVVGEAGDGATALALCASLRPDIVLMALGLPGLNGIEATRRLTAAGFGGRVVGLAVNASRFSVHAMFEVGAWAYLVKSSATAELILAMRAVSRGERYVSPALAGLLLESFCDGAQARTLAGGYELTPRETEVLTLLSEGMTSKEIATRLAVATATIVAYRKQVMGKLDLHSVAELTRYAIRSGLTLLE
jgi:two-component system NarL family response regulator